MSTYRTSFPALRATAVLALSFCGAQAMAAALTENFNTVTPAGWTVTNNSSTVGTTDWFQGNPTVFAAQSGADSSYAGANFNATTGAGTISDWLIAPTLTFNNGDTISFYTRTVDSPAFADRLELRFSNVGGTNVGATSTSVGSFTSLLLTVNPALTATGYPSAWTQYTTTLTGLAGPTTGAIAFRYFVTNGGPDGANSDYIGIDTLAITPGLAPVTPVPEPSTYLLMALGVAALAVRRARSTRA